MYLDKKEKLQKFFVRLTILSQRPDFFIVNAPLMVLSRNDEENTRSGECS